MNTYTVDEKNIIDEGYRQLCTELQSVMDVDRMTYINKAFRLAMETYDGRYMVSGKPYVKHLVDLAYLTGVEIGLGSVATVSCFLHGITYKSDVTIEMVEQLFGKSVANIVVGYDRLSNIQTERVSYQSETFRNLFLSLVDDIRVVLLMVVHRLYDIRNQNDVEPDKLKKYIREIKFLVIPIVHRLGWYIIKAEFEEKVMLYENPVEYQNISQKIIESKAMQEKMMNAFIDPIKKGIAELDSDNGKRSLDCTIKWRTKSISSIYTKMKAQNVDFDHVYDIFAVRIIINNSLPKNEKEDCWRVYSVVTNLYQPNPKRLRDWITTPKASGYESLHTTVNNDNKWVEVQIRTKRMDEVAEQGQAAHWQYKSHYQNRNEEDWLNQIRDVIENPKQIDFDNIASATKKFQSNKIFIITPNGDLKQLPVGSTVLDFAFEIHTQVGSTCSGARVNNKVEPIRHVLSNGDKVEIITNKNQKPRADWLNFVNTDKAKNKIKRYLQEEEMKFAELGKALFFRKMKNWKQKPTDELMNELLHELKLENSVMFYSQLFNEQIDINRIKKIVLSFTDDESKPTKKEEVVNAKKIADNDKDDILLLDNGLDDTSYHFAKCCNPIYGDDVFGFITIGGSGITIHRLNCPNAKRLRELYSYRIVNVKWNNDNTSSMFRATIKFEATDTLGLLGNITDVISNKLKINMSNITVSAGKNKMIEGKIVLQVQSSELLDFAIKKLRELEGITNVSRID